ncbi:MAG: sigma-70 family RNA polymerase sigma factor [Planctomycetota bacterium]
METGDVHERFTRLLIQHEPELLRSILVVIPHRNDARDVLQECSVALWRRFDDFDPSRPFVPWALGFVRVEIRRFLRQSRRRSVLTERAATLLLADQDRDAAERDRRERYLTRCVEQLNATQRELIRGYYDLESSIPELADRTGRSVDAVYKMLQRIRQNLQKCVELKMEATG